MENNRHLKGYMFDSLVYRFKDYQHKAFEHDIMMYKSDRNISRIDAELAITHRHERDLMRFMEILNEAMGDHD